MVLRPLWILIVLSLILCGCQRKESTKMATRRPTLVKVEVQSSAFGEGEMIPTKYTCNGDGISPPLRWSHLPAGTKSLALVVDDPDAASGVFVHWVLFNIPAGSGGLPEAVSAQQLSSDGAVQGRNSARKLGYTPPCPPSGVHRYRFTVYALDAKLDLRDGATKSELLEAAQDHLLGEGILTGKYGDGS